MRPITPMLWFNDQAEEAANFYVSIFPDSKVRRVARYPADLPGKEGSVMTVDFQLQGQDFVALNGGPTYTLSEAVSFVVYCETQEEVDHYWEKLAAGGQEVQCGWLKDKFGLSWQVTPTILADLASDPDRAKAARVMQAMMARVKLDSAELKKAAERK